MADINTTRQDATLRDFLNVVFRRKYMVLAFVLVTTTVIIYFNARKPVSYVSGSRIMVKRGERSSVFTGGVRYLPWNEEMSSQIQAMLSEEVFARAREIFADSVKARGISTPMKFRGGAVRADVVGESNVFSIAYTGPDPIACQLGCAAVTEAYAEYYRRKSAPPQDLQRFFETEIQDVAEELEGQRAARNAFLKKQKYPDMGDESNFYMNRLITLEGQESALESQVASQRLRVDNFSELLGLSREELEDKLAFSVSRTVIQSGIITNIKYSLQNLRIRREELLQKYTDRHPYVVAIDNQIEDLLTDLRQEVENSYNIEYRELEELVAKKKLVDDEIAEIKTALSTLPDKQAELTRIDARIRNLEERYEFLLGRRNEAELALVSAPEWEVTVLATASRATPQNTKDYVRMAVGPILALVIGLGIAYFMESLDHSIKTVGEVEEYLGSTVLATISETRSKG